MKTKNFNAIDKTIAKMRLRKVSQFVNKDDVVLDFGCGYQAFFLKSISDKISKGWGIDYEVENDVSFKNLTLMNLNYQGNLPFEDKKFDKIFLLAVYEHIPLESTVSLLIELKRVLKDNGKIVLTIPTPKGKSVMEFLAFKLGVISRAEIADHKKYYSKEDIHGDATKAGLCLSYHRYFQFGWNSLQVLEKNND
ncbi:MAG: class I SAM-dependent methyltransferase [Candidatus Nomurabacteria bacterium]|nr:class I SAM-dependent methyltransferase [Candidatus Nomurabacteria bacterium]